MSTLQIKKIKKVSKHNWLNLRSEEKIYITCEACVAEPGLPNFRHTILEIDEQMRDELITQLLNTYLEEDD